jgi:hypothetical protein
MKKWKIDRIISIATLVTSVAALFLVLKRPAPVAAPQTAAQAAANAQSFQDKISRLQQPAPRPQASVDSVQTATQPDSSDSDASDSGNSDSDAASVSAPQSSDQSSSPQASEVHITSDEINAAIAQAAGTLSGSAGDLSPSTDLGAMPTIKDQRVSFDGDIVHGQFLTTIAGKDVWVTVAGHLGEKDGYATFDPTEFKVGDLNIPVSLVNGPLQEKLAEQRDRLKLPDSVGGVNVQDGQLVLKQK